MFAGKPHGLMPEEMHEIHARGSGLRIPRSGRPGGSAVGTCKKKRSGRGRGEEERRGRGPAPSKESAASAGAAAAQTMRAPFAEEEDGLSAEEEIR